MFISFSPWFHFVAPIVLPAVGLVWRAACYVSMIDSSCSTPGLEDMSIDYEWAVTSVCLWIPVWPHWGYREMGGEMWNVKENKWRLWKQSLAAIEHWSPNIKICRSSNFIFGILLFVSPTTTINKLMWPKAEQHKSSKEPPIKNLVFIFKTNSMTPVESPMTMMMMMWKICDISLCAKLKDICVQV